MESTPGVEGLPETIIALLGRRDQPTDGVRDYCARLAAALRPCGILIQPAECDWRREGWPKTLRRLWKESSGWQGRWVLFNYTALSWSRRGFPFMALALLWLLRLRGSRIAALFHDVNASPPTNWLESMRVAIQYRVMCAAYRVSEKSIVTMPIEQIEWLPRQPSRATFIPIGANIPEPQTPRRRNGQFRQGPKTVAVFGITGGDAGPREVEDIAYTMSRVKKQVDQLRLVVMGRGSEEARKALEQALKGSGLDASVLGVLPAGEVTRTLLDADVLLFVRGDVTPRRSSAIAGIACGLPVVGYGDPAASFPVSEAGVQLVPRGDQEALAAALGRVLTDGTLWDELHQRSRKAQAKYFSWDAIAKQFRGILGHG